MKRIIIFSTVMLVALGLSAFYTPLYMATFRNDWLEKLKAIFEEAQSKYASERIYLHVDKTLYKPGETIWFQAYLRNTDDMKPSSQSDIIRVELIGPRGNTEQEYALITDKGSASGDFTIAPEANGGLYTLKAYTEWQKNGKNPFFFTKEIQVQKVVLPRLKMKLDFEKEAYGMGDEVIASLSLENLDNTPLTNYTFSYSLQVEGIEVTKGKSKTDDEGKATIADKLPNKISSPDGLLLIMLDYKGQSESISRSVPIVLNNFALDFFPEGGDMIAGVESRVAFRILNEFDKPADAVGIILNKEGKEVAKFESFHQGMGSVTFTPKANEQYTAKITQPKGVSQEWELPKVLSKGYALRIEQEEDKELIIKINAPLEETLSLVGQLRDKIYVMETLNAKQGENQLSINTEDLPVGVAQFTLFDAKEIERAERLVFLNRDKKLNVNITPNKTQFRPREEVSLNISITDERGIPVPGQFSLAVVDDKLLSFTDDKQGHIISKLLLEPDLTGDIFEPNFYFDEKEEKSLAALDLLMMTQGWRKFTWAEIREGIAEPQFMVEKAIIAGKVVKFGKPMGNTKVEIKPDNISVRTNTEGEFKLKNIKLYEAKTLELSDKKGVVRTVPVASYSQNMVIDLQPPIRMAMRRNAREVENAPMAMMMDEVAEEEIEFEKNAFAAELQGKVAGIEVKENQVEADMELADVDMDDFGEGDIANEALNEVVIIDQQRIALDRPAVKPVAPAAVTYHRAREFPVPVYKTKEAPKKRTDFRSTIFWKGDIATDRSGTATVSFPTSDEITAFRATLEGIGNEGTVGRGETVFYNQLSFSMDVKIPVAVSMADELQIPLTLTNTTDKELEGELSFMHPKSWEVNGKLPSSVSIAPESSKTFYLPYSVLNQPGKDTIAIAFNGNGLRDAFEQEINVAEKGFPVNLAFSAQKDEAFDFKLSNVVEGTLEARVTAFPSMLSDLLAGIESILREPYGCFEQTSSSTYPNLLVKRYLEESGIENATASAKADALIEKGYERLVSFETEENGYEWFGGTPAHEALTAYGLMEFKEMSKVYSGVSNDMVKRTADWLLSRRDGNGGFKKDPKALDSFGRADDDITNAYIVYSLSKAGYGANIQKELDAAVKNAEQSQDPYQLGLVTNALFNVEDLRATQFLNQLQAHQQEDGSWLGKKHSITHSTGIGLTIETTSLAVMAHLKAAQINRKAVEDAATFIVASRSPYGGFGNSQSTIMALEALTDYATFAKQTQEDGTIEVYKGNKKIATTSYEAGVNEAIVIEGLSAALQEGKNTLSVKYVGAENPLPYTLSVVYHSTQPQSSDSCKVRLATSLTSKKIKVGETVRLTTELKNTTEEGLPMTLAIVGIPGGLSAQPWQLKELQEKGIVDYYEINDRQVVFYYRQMKPSESKEINLDLKAEIAGNYQGAASTAYLYYTDEFKDWVAGETIEVEQ